jgi:integrase
MGERWDAESGHWTRDYKAKTRPRKRPEAAATLLRSNLVNAKLDGQTVGDFKVRDLTRRQLVRLLQGIVDRGAPVTANRVYSLLVQTFKWAVAQDVVPASPMAGIEKPGGHEQERRRFLSAEEVRTFWTKLESASMALPTRLALKLLLVTGQRRGELTFAKWTDFDLDAKRWTIPVALLKSSHARRADPEPHVVPLSPLALELLRELHKLTGESEHVLPARADKRKSQSYSERVLSRAVRENANHFGIEHFTPHDLRRTAASFMTKLKVPRLHVEKVLNHSTGDIAEVYDRHDYLPEKRAALLKWGAHLQGIIAGENSNVVELPRTDRRAASRRS